MEGTDVPNSSFSDQRARTGAEKRPKDSERGWVKWGLEGQGEGLWRGMSEEK